MGTVAQDNQLGRPGALRLHTSMLQRSEVVAVHDEAIASRSEYKS